MFMNPIRFVSGEAESPAWKSTEAKAGMAVSQILAAVARKSAKPAAARRR
jgi:hypothetical protein